jgi:Uma2 family endonuclease
MTVSPLKTLTLEAFLQLPQIEASPPWEYINGTTQQKPMPKTRHSLLQKRLLVAIDVAIDHGSDTYTTLPELRCTFGGRSIVPDIAVIAWDRIPVNEIGEPEDNFIAAPDWTIEILSPDQKTTRVIDNILHCLEHGCKLGWMLDPDDYSVMIFAPNQSPQMCRGDRPLTTLPAFNLSLTAAQVFNWLNVSDRHQS